VTATSVRQHLIVFLTMREHGRVINCFLVVLEVRPFRSSTLNYAIFLTTRKNGRLINYFLVVREARPSWVS
jgi:hypothetical protein